MNDDERRAYEREKKRRQRAAGRGQILSPTGDIGVSRGHDLSLSPGQIGDKILDKLDAIMSKLVQIEHQLSGVLSPVPPSKGDRETGTPLGTGTGTCPGDKGTGDKGTGDKGTDPVWEFDDEGRVRRYTGTRGDDPTIPARTWPDPRRTEDHVDAAENGIRAARAELDRNRWHPSEGPRHA